MKKRNNFTPLAVLTLSLVFIPFNTIQAADNSDIGYLAGSGFTSLIYTPIKGAFALLMGITGGLSLMATVPTNKSNISIDLVKIGSGGDWWVSPDHLRGKRTLNFTKP